jgi:hypothetical protein
MLCLTFALLVGCDAGRKDVDREMPATNSEITTTVTKVDAANLPPDLVAAVTGAIPGMQIEGAERKEREDRVYYDVEGRRPDGSEVELDVLQEGNNYTVVEIQRDISWDEAPEVARAAAAASQKTFEPVRVIESTQTDGSVIYELFAEGAPEKPSLEVRVIEGKAEVLEEEWLH